MELTDLYLPLLAQMQLTELKGQEIPGPIRFTEEGNIEMNHSSRNLQELFDEIPESVKYRI